MSAGALPGFRDFYPEQFAQRSWLFDRWRDVARRFGYAEYDGPPLEPLELYTKKSGDEIVGQLYNFEDKGGRAVALRPEMTPTVARMVAAKANALRKPVRWFSIPQLFRYERQQKGRLREHFQLNVDIFGESDVSADAELLAVGCWIMRECGLEPNDVIARVSDRRLLSALLTNMGIAGELQGVAFAAIDKVDRDERAALVKKMADGGIRAPIAERVIELVHTADLALLRRDFGSDEAVSAALDRLEEYTTLLDAHGVREYFRLDLRIVRGLAYYTGIVFELFDARGEFRAVCGGGRYDTLLSALGGADLPALGFGMGDVVLGELLKARGKEMSTAEGMDVFVVPQAGVDAVSVVRAASALRAMGLATSHVLNMQKLRTQKTGAQLEVGVKSGARFALILNGASGGMMRPLTAQGGEFAVDLGRALGDGSPWVHTPGAALGTFLKARLATS